MILRARFVLPVATPPIPDGALWVEAETIRAVGDVNSVRLQGRGEPIDLGDTVLLPGLINAHCHLELTDMAGAVPFEGSFTNWLQSLVSLKKGWGQEQYEASASGGAKMLLETGTTSVADVVSWWPVAPKLQRAPLRVWSFLEMIDFAGQKSWRDWVESAEDWIAKSPNHRGGWGLSPHAPYTATDQLYRASVELRKKLTAANLLLTTHICESTEERWMFEEGRGPLYEWLVRLGRDMHDCGGQSSLEMLYRLKILNDRTLGVHLNGLDEDEIKLVADVGMSVVHCPASHQFFGHPPFPLEQLLARGVNVCMGTDSLASAPAGATLDMFAEMRLAARAYPGLSPEIILRLATMNGARAMHADDRLGTLEKGKSADVIGLRLPANASVSNIHELIVNEQMPLAFVMIHGETITR